MNFTLPETDLWEYLSRTEKTVVMYGMGNGADKILAVCERRGIAVADFFASDGFVRGHAFHGKTVLSYSAVKEKYRAENLIALLSFASSRPEVLEQIRRVAGECELYAPDVPVCGEDLFDLPFALAHQKELEAAEALLCDEESRHIFRNTVLYRLTGRISYLFDAESDRDEVYRRLLRADRFEVVADIGAYNGDTIRELIPYAEHLRTVYAMEPDRHSYRKLTEYAESVHTPQIAAVRAAAWSHACTLSFSAEGNRNSGVHAGKKCEELPALPPDSLFTSGLPDYIKYDVEGAEWEALTGTMETIRKRHPALLVSLYHRSEDLFSLPLRLAEAAPGYRFYLRRYPYIPAWDLNLICL